MMDKPGMLKVEFSLGNRLAGHHRAADVSLDGIGIANLHCLRQYFYSRFVEGEYNRLFLGGGGLTL